MKLMTIQVASSHTQDTSNSLDQHSVVYNLATTKGFNGADLSSFLIDISKIAIPTIAYLVLQLYREKKVVNLKLGNKEYKGSVDNLDNIRAFLLDGEDGDDN